MRWPHSQVVQVPLLAVLYLIAAKYSLLLAIPPGNATAVWPPAGIALSALLLFGSRLWPGVWVGAALANLLNTDVSLVTGALIGTGDTLEALAATILIRRFVKLRYRFESADAVFKFAFCAALCAVVAASIGTLSLAWAHLLAPGQFAVNWWTWWLGDSAGIVVVTPLILAWAEPRHEEHRPKNVGETFLFAGLLLAALALIFGGRIDQHVGNLLAYVIIPFVVWAGYRLNHRVVTTSILLISGFSVWDSLDGQGVFVFALPDLTLHTLQTFVVCVALMGLAVAAVTGQRERALEALRQSRDGLELVAEERTLALKQVNEELRIDVAERKQAQTALLAAQNTLRELIDVLPVAVYTCDASGLLESYNRRAAALWGREARLGDASDRYCGSQQMYGVDGRYLPHSDSPMARALGARTPVLDREIVIERPDGTRRVAIVNAIPKWDALGTLSGGIGCLFDITERIESEDRMRRSERMLSEAERMAHLGSWEWDIPADRVKWSDELFRLYGLEPGSFGATYGAYIQRVHPDDRERVHGAIQRALNDREPFAFEERIVRPDGTVRHLLSHGEVQTEGGRAVRMIGTCLDVTDRKRADRELRESEARFRSLTAMSSDWYWEQDENFRFVEGNSDGVDWAGLAPHAVFGKTRWEVPEAYLGVSEEEWREHRAMLERREAFTELAFKRLDRSGNERHFCISGEPFFDEAGKFLGYRGVGRDITDQVRAQRKLHESESRFRAMWEASPDVVVVMDPEGRILYANSALLDVFGYRPDEIAGQPLSLLEPEALSAARRDAMHRYLHMRIKERSWQMTQTTGRHRDRREFPIEIAFSEFTADGLQLFAGFIRDITERKEIENRIKSSNEQLRALSARLQSVRESERVAIAREVHDELGQALTAATMDLKVLERYLRATRRGLSRERVIGEIASISGVIHQCIQTVQKIATELRPLVLDDLGLIPALEWQAKSFESHSRIPCSFTTRIPALDIGKDRAIATFRIFQETLTNIARHAHANSVAVEIFLEGGNLVIDVKDDGVGIRDSDIRDPRSIGLLGMRERATALGGEIVIKGKKGKGTTVTIRIPADPGKIAVSDRGEASELPPGSEAASSSGPAHD